MRQIVRTATLASLLALSGCASLSESQCLASDWKTIGHRDGLSGAQSSQLLRHQNACMKHGVTPDRETYLAGWYEGVYQYCDSSNAFNVGARGAVYNNVCPEEMRESFYAAYQEGRRIYQAQAEINSLTRAIAQKEMRLEEIKDEMAAIAGYMVDAESTPGERVEMLLAAKDLAEEQGRLENEIHDLQMDVAVKADRLESLRLSVAAVTY